MVVSKILHNNYYFFRGSVSGSTNFLSRGQNPDDYKVVVGMHDRKKKDGKTIAVKTIRVHPQFQVTTNSHDVALITLSEGVLHNENVGAIGLPARDAPDGLKCRITGWGNTKGFL